MNQNLAHDLDAPASGFDLTAAGQQLARDLGTTNDVSGLLRTFARHAGALAKACESLDHMERFPFRNAMQESNLALFKLVTAAAAAWSLDLGTLYAARLRVVEEGRSSTIACGPPLRHLRGELLER